MQEKQNVYIQERQKAKASQGNKPPSRPDYAKQVCTLEKQLLPDGLDHFISSVDLNMKK